MSFPRTVLVASIVFASALPVSAQSVDDRLQEGVELRRARRDVEAAELFRRIYEETEDPRALAQLGLAEQALGRWVDAEAHVAAALETDHPWIAERRAVLERSLAAIRRHTAALEILTNVRGAEILVDGELVGVAPLGGFVAVAAGERIVEVRAEGHETRRRTVDVPAQRQTRVTIPLVPVLRRPEPTSPRPPEGPIEARSEAPPPPTPGPTPPPRRPPWGTLAWAAGSATLLLGAGTLTAAAIREAQVRRYNDDSRCLPAPGGRRSDVCPGAFRAFRTARDWAIGLGVAASAAAVGTLVLAILEASGEDRVADALRLGPGGVGAAF